MMDCLQEVLVEMIENYDICYSDQMTPTQYKTFILAGIDKTFEKVYNDYLIEREKEREEWEDDQT